MARKKKIPSIDQALEILFERIQGDFEAEVRRLREQVSALGRKVTGLERRLQQMQHDASLQQLRPEGAPMQPRKRVSPEKAYTAILARLKRARGKFVTSKELGSPLGVGRATVAHRITELRDQGHRIESSPRKGYALDT